MAEYVYDGVFHQGIFIERQNRFVAIVELNGQKVQAHLKNTGRLTEILIKGSVCWLMEASTENRKTKYDLISICVNNTIINLDSQVTNKLVEVAFIEKKIRGYEEFEKIVGERKYKNSRFDFYLESEKEVAYVEVKGVNLVIGDQASFPDAKTTRGVKHLLELKEIKEKGLRALLIFIIQRNDCKSFISNKDRDPEFSKALNLALEAGVEVRAYKTKVSYNKLILDEEIELMDLKTIIRK